VPYVALHYYHLCNPRISAMHSDMMMQARNLMLLTVLALTSACSMMEEPSQASLQQRDDWFEYAYYSSEATLAQDGMQRSSGTSKVRSKLY